jgi:3-hydroxyisobutyrate dehydrogenase-like beta-hydroxyacid dehydrogenase
MNTDQPPVAVLGLGGMGLGLALSLVRAGFPVIGYNRTRSKGDPLAAAGGTVAATAGDAVAAATVVVVSLADESVVEDLLFRQLAGRFCPGTTVIDTSTVSSSFSLSARQRLAALGHARVEACVVGNPMMAAAGKLRIFTAGTTDQPHVEHVLAALGQSVTWVGEGGAACALKVAFNLVLGNQIVAVAEAVTFAEQAGLSREIFLDALTESGFSSPTLSFRAAMMKVRQYEPAAFRAVLMEKDLRLAIDQAADHELDLPVTACAAERFATAVAAGHGDHDAAVVAGLPA